MALFTPSASKVTLAQFMLGAATPANQLLKLFTNNVTPALAHVAADYTEMTSGQNSAYSAKTLNKASWTVTFGGSTGSAVQSTQTWTFAAGTPTTVYGYFITDSGSGLLLWAETFTIPKVVQFAGDQIIIIPTITLA